MLPHPHDLSALNVISRPCYQRRALPSMVYRIVGDYKFCPGMIMTPITPAISRVLHARIMRLHVRSRYPTFSPPLPETNTERSADRRRFHLLFHVPKANDVPRFARRNRRSNGVRSRVADSEGRRGNWTEKATSSSPSSWKPQRMGICRIVRRQHE